MKADVGYLEIFCHTGMFFIVQRREEVSPEHVGLRLPGEGEEEHDDGGNHLLDRPVVLLLSANQQLEMNR
jgi:hypothetical protein